METQVESVDVAAASSANSYAILAKLATGGMAELFLARTASTAGVERYVVLKRVLPEKLDDREFVTMFLDEARLAAQLQHPNIAQVFDTGKLGESYFFSMEYVHGETVRELLHRAHELDQRIPLACVLTIAANAAAGLHHAHERVGLDGRPLGIVHRDVSPSNLMVSFEGNVKLVDFGVAKAATHRSVETQTGTVKGKIGYLSPEQCRGRTSDRRGDLFSLGIMIWELLTGTRLYKRANDYDTMEAIVLEPTPAPSTLRPEVSPELDAIVLKLLAKAPGDRYQTADELFDELERVADQSGIRISNASLKRFVVELFGKRPEPWLELQLRDAVPEVVTVSIKGLDTTATLIDSQLQHVLDLTRTLHPQRASATTPVPNFREPVLPRIASGVETSSGRTVKIAMVACVVTALVGFAWVRLQHDEARGALPLPRLDASPHTPSAAPPPPHQPPPAPAPQVIAPAAIPKSPIHGVHHDDLATELRTGKFADVVAACIANSRQLAQSAAICTLAACAAHDSANAIAWFARVSTAKRPAISAQCASDGTVVEAVAKKATCETDPSLCHRDPPPPAPKKNCDDPMECWK